MKRFSALLLLALVFVLPVGAQTRDHAIRHGRTMAYTSADGVSHPQSFWVLSFAAFDVGAATGRLEFIAYHSAAAYDSGATPIAGAVRSYQISPAEWTQVVRIPLPAPDQTFDVNFVLAAWNVALQTKDVCDSPPDGRQQTCVSFFAGSVPAQ